MYTILPMNNNLLSSQLLVSGVLQKPRTEVDRAATSRPGVARTKVVEKS